MTNHNKILVFDFETSGLSPKDSQVIEIGAMLLKKEDDKYRLLEELNVLVQTDAPLPAKIVEITNITDEMLLRDGITEEEAFGRLSSLIDDETLLIAYNIQFDISFLQAMYQKFYNKTHQIKNDLLDVMAIYKDRHPFPHRLESAVSKYQIQAVNTHRALDDVYATFELLRTLRREKDTISMYVNKIGFNPKYGVSGVRLTQVKYIPQYGNRLEVEKA